MSFRYSNNRLKFLTEDVKRMHMLIVSLVLMWWDVSRELRGFEFECHELHPRICRAKNLVTCDDAGVGVPRVQYIYIYIYLNFSSPKKIDLASNYHCRLKPSIGNDCRLSSLQPAVITPFTTGPQTNSDSWRLSLPIAHCRLQNRQ